MRKLNETIINVTVEILDFLYKNRDIQRFWVLEEIARAPYFAFLSVLHFKESLGLRGDQHIYLMKEHNITDYFFLDQSFPFLIRWSNKGEQRCAVRVSEFESVETALSIAGKVDWVWLDCFTDFPINKYQFDFLKDAAFKICLVSPELQGRNGEDEIKNMSLTLKNIDIKLDAVCTKNPYLWEKMLLEHV